MDEPTATTTTTTTDKIFIVQSPRRMPHRRSKITAPPPPNTKRVCTDTTRWHNNVSAPLLESSTAQLAMLQGTDPSAQGSMLRSQIMAKLAGYRAQDIEKGLYDEAAFVDYVSVREKLVECGMRCYYCGEAVYVLYETVRAKRQWSIDRVDNSRGHNRDNFVIACLECNLHRRCRKFEEFYFTENLIITKEP